MNYEPMAAVSDKRGLALFEEVIEEIEAHEFKTWDQKHWLAPGGDFEDDVPATHLREDVRETLIPAFDCGTTACLFGHIAFKGGARLDIFTRSNQTHVSNVDVEVDGDRVAIWSYATKLLGLADDHAGYISDGYRTWKEIVAFRDAWRLDAAAGPDVVVHRDELIWG